MAMSMLTGMGAKAIMRTITLTAITLATITSITLAIILTAAGKADLPETFPPA